MSEWDKTISEYESDISKATKEYVKASNILPYSVKEIKSIYSEDELQELAIFLREMKDATDDNEKKLALIGKYKKTVLGLVKLAKIVI